jgi:hypothetical protein
MSSNDTLFSLPQALQDRINSISEDELAFRGWTRDQMRAKYEERIKLDLNSPQIGDKAPDFELEMLSENGKRTHNTLRLSSLRGKPVGLIFGSYT